MSDAAGWGIWGVAVLLVSAGVTADGFLARMFLHDRQVARSEGRSRRARWRHALPTAVIEYGSTRSQHPRALAALAAVGLAAGVATAQPADDPSGAERRAKDTTPPPSTAQLTRGSLPARAAQPEPQSPPEAPPVPTPVSSAISVQLNLDFTSAYFYRGIRQQDKGLIVQPAARLTTRLVDEADFKLDGFIGTWNSFGPNGGTQTGGLIEDWYESDLYAGFALTDGKLSLTTSYTFLTSPSDAYQEVQELGFTLALDDSEWLNAWALKPYATLAIETGSNGSDGSDLDNGVYLELGIAPGFSFDIGSTPVTLAFPASVGLSLSDYYQDAGGNDDAFGFAQIGAKASIPLGEPGRFGAWTLSAGVSVLFLGDHTKAFNSGDDTRVIGTIGLQWSF